jgi:hypothetical protein
MPVRHACAIQSLVTDAKNAECWLLQDSNYLSTDAFKPRSSADGDWDAALSILFPPAAKPLLSTAAFEYCVRCDYHL